MADKFVGVFANPLIEVLTEVILDIVIFPICCKFMSKFL